MAMKLDMAKAYGRMEWSFLRSMMIKLGFHIGWLDNIMMCVQLISYAILVNGIPSKSFTFTLGIRKGDFMSPFFVSVMYWWFICIVTTIACKKEN